MVLTHNRTSLWRWAEWVQWNRYELNEHALDFIASNGGLFLWSDVRHSSSDEAWHYDSADFNRWAARFPWMGWRWPTFSWDSSGEWGWKIHVPLWSLLLALWALPTWSFLRRLLRRPGRCVYCRFDLRPLPTRQAITCPYCYRTNFRILKSAPRFSDLTPPPPGPVIP
ncbi:MAG: hypothetical protein IT436_09430 [Phycisphaerales bacterium]|nr:hypothetical protein [Phycisphaerales bacterium]